MACLIGRSLTLPWQRCFALVEDLPAREMARRGWVCAHSGRRLGGLRAQARNRAERECQGRQDGGREPGDEDHAEAEGGSVAADPDGTPGATSPRKQRSRKGRSVERMDSEEERLRILRQIEALDRKNLQLKKVWSSVPPAFRPPCHHPG